MSVPPLSESRLRAQVQALREKAPNGGVIAIHTPGPWTGPASIRVDGRDIRVVYCPSVLAVREQLVASTGAEADLVLLTDRVQTELDADVLARLFKRRLVPVEVWRVVMDLFGAHEVDPRLLDLPWMADALLESAPPNGYPKVASSMLDVDTAWAVILRERFGFVDPQPDVRALLRWTLQPDSLVRFERSAPDMQTGIAARFGDMAGPAGRAIARAVRAGRGPDAVALGLACRVLFAPASAGESSLREAVVRLEPAMGGHSLTSVEGLPWAEAAEVLVREIAASEGARAAAPWHDRADALLRELRVQEFAWLSPALIVGFDQRLVRYAGALRRAVEDPATDLGDLEAAASAVLEHDQARAHDRRAQWVRMTVRLAQKLRQGPAAGEPGSFADAAVTYAADGAFADWARGVAGEGDALAPVADACRRLVERVTDERERENRRFGELLASWTALGSSSGAVVPVESVLSAVVAPLAREAPVLLVVMDGLSFPVFHELAADLTREGWVELGAGQPPRRRPAIAAFPTITQVSRASLLAGALRTGDAGIERQSFAACADLVAISRSGYPPVLFHKADLVEEGGVGLAAAVRAEIARAARQVVGVVINAVDDNLARGDQLKPLWTLSSIGPLSWVLDAARAARRIVVLTSDHGHVLDRDMTYRPQDSGGHRHRVDDGAPAPDELALRGPRVLTPSGGVIVPWSERVRYGVRQHGYHGGATPQEVVIPLAVFSAERVAPTGWGELPPLAPSWWETPEPEMPRPAVVARPAVVVDKIQPDLFGPAEPAALVQALPKPTEPLPVKPAGPGAATGGTRDTPAVPAWIDRLLAAPTYAAQKRLAGRGAPPDDQVRRCLLALEARGGKLTQVALARALGVPELRIAGMVVALRRLLNVEGYPVLSLDEASSTVALNVQLLTTQFEL